MSTRAWLARAHQRWRPPGLDYALLTNRGYVYAGYRLSLVWMRALSRTALHAAELWLMLKSFPFEFAVPIFAMRATYGMLASTSFGPLEALRRRVREHMKLRQRESALQRIEAFIQLGWLLGLPLVAHAVIVSFSASELEWAYDGLYGSYLLVGSFCVAVDLPLRSFHAGVFALGRIYRPTWTLLGPDLLELATLIVVWQRLGPFALGASLLATSPLRSLLSFIYARRAYAARRLRTPRLFRPQALRSLRREDLTEGFGGLLAMVPGQLDRLLVVALLASSSADPMQLPLAAPYYALRPVAGACQSWARAYHADLVRLDTTTLTLLRQRFEHLLRRVTLVAGALSAAALIGGGQALFGVDGALAACWFAPLLLLRSHLAVVQVRALAYGRVDAIVRLSLAIVAVLGATLVLDLSDRVLIAVVTALLFGALPLLIDPVSRAASRFRASARRMSAAAFLADVSAEKGAARIRAVLVDRGLARVSAVQVRLGQVPGIQRTCRVGHAWLLWWEHGGTPVDEEALVVCLSGTAQLSPVAEGMSGADALNRALAAGIVPEPLASALSTPRDPAPADALRRAFARLPGGQVLEVAKASGGLTAVPVRDLGIVRAAIAREVREQRAAFLGAPWEVAVYSPRGEPVLVFLWKPCTEGGRFRRQVLAASWRASTDAGLVALAVPSASGPAGAEGGEP